MTQNSIDLSHHFLIAMPDMADPVFSGTVTYILQHGDDGAMGVIINRPINLTLGEVFSSVHVLTDKSLLQERAVYHGGPVSSEQGFILHRPTERVWDGSLCNDDLCLTTSRDVLDAIAIGEGPADFLFCLGYSGWSEGQLEQELKENAWLTVAADSDIIFGTDEQGKYQRALSTLGVDLSTLAGRGGLA